MKIGKNVSNGKGKAISCRIDWLSDFPGDKLVLFSRSGDFCWQLRKNEREGSECFLKFILDKEGVDMSTDEYALRAIEDSFSGKSSFFSESGFDE